MPRLSNSPSAERLPGVVTDTPRTALAAVRLLEADGSPGLDRLTRRASQVLGVPTVLVGLLTDWDEVFVSSVGLPEALSSDPRTHLAHSFGRQLVHTNTALVITDIRDDQRLRSHPGVAEFGIVAFAGFPLRTPDGTAIGSFSAIDVRPRTWSDADLAVLESLGEAAGAQIALVLERDELQTSTADLQRVFENINDLVRTVEVRPGGRFRAVYSSSKTQDVLGGTLTGDPDTDVNDTLFSMVASEDQSRYEAFRRQVRAGVPAEVEYRMHGIDGVLRWLWTRATIRREGERLFVDAITRNVTERKQVENALEEERRRLRQAQTIARIGSWEWDPATDVVTWSDTLYELYGVDPAKFSAEEANPHVIHPDDLPELRRQFSRCARTGESLHLQYRVVRPVDGRLRIFEARAEALYGAGIQVLRLAGTAADITEQVSAQQEVNRREALLQAILDNHRKLIYVKDAAGEYKSATESMLRAAVEQAPPTKMNTKTA